ncbi:hypothetical protein N0V90_004918 [Kalmusia sp. IMI 367209]|nr:hypothetical protein N0V90_004918 [Kalmusia sp. IMI 367209]
MSPLALGSGAGKSRPVSNDSFASLTGLMRSKNSWTAAPSPGATPALPAQVSNGRPNSTLPARVRPIEHFRNENTFSAPTPTRAKAIHLATETSTPVQSSPSLRSPIELGTADKTASTFSHEHDYNEADMRRMEDMIAEMKNIDDTHVEGLLENTTDTEHASQAAQQIEALSQTLIGFDTTQQASLDNDETYFSPSEPVVCKAQKVPIVRCTESVWENMMKQLSTHKQDKMDALPKVTSMERDEHQCCPKGDDSNELAQLRYRLEVNKDYKAAMSRDIRQKDDLLCKQELEIDALKKEVADMEILQEQLGKLRAEVEYFRTSATEEKEASARSLAQIMSSHDKEIANLKDDAARSEAKISSHQSRAENLADTQAMREKKLRQTEKQLETAQDEKLKLLDEIDDLKSMIRPLQQRLKDSETQLREKSSGCDRMRNDLRHTEKRLEFTMKALNKVENHNQLKGAAHLIVPNEKTKLPKLVLPCMECFVKNIDCDSRSRCQNCIDQVPKISNDVIIAVTTIASILVLGISIASGTIRLDDTHVPDVFLGIKTIDAGPLGPQSLIFGLHTGIDDAVLTSAYLFIIASVVLTLHLAVLRHIKRLDRIGA